MKTPIRALLAVALLAGYYVLAFGLLAVLVTLNVVLFLSGHLAGLVAVKVMAVSVPIAGAIIRGVFMVGNRSRKAGKEEEQGFTVSEAQQPELWAKVRQLAAAVGTRPPDEIHLVPMVNAGVSERTRMLGLLSGKRIMVIGTPLLIGLTERQLEAILAHELGHYANRDTRLSGLTYRGRAALIHTLIQFRGTKGLDAALGKVFIGYAKLYFRVSDSVCRRQELAADQASVRVAGAAATADALSRTEPLNAAWNFFMQRYATFGVDQGYLPRDVMGGFARLIAEPKRQQEMAQLAQKQHAAGAEESSPYDSHPPTSQRVQLVLAGDPGPAPTAPDRPAYALIRDPQAVFEGAFDSSLNARGRTLNRLDWDEFMHRTVRDAAAQFARPLFRASVGMGMYGNPTVPMNMGTVLNALQSPGAARMGELLPGEAPSGFDRTRDDFMRQRTRELLDALVDVALADAGRARWQLSWSESTSLSYAQGIDAQSLAKLLDAAVAPQPDVTPLRNLLISAGIPETYMF